MGKLTDSLKATTKQFDQIKHGIQQMQELGRELAENTATVAGAALKTGYAYAQAEMATQAEDQAQMAGLPSNQPVLDADQLGQAAQWTEKLLKARFGDFRSAYDYLRDTHNIAPKPRSWQAVVDAFNNGSHDRAPADQVAQLEQIITLQNQRIAVLEAKLDQVLQHLQITL